LKIDEEDKSQGQDRDERRYIEKLNRVERQKRKKTEMTRLRNLVDRAYALDPRIKKQKKEEQQRKDDDKLRRKQENDRRRQEQKQREIDEAKRIADEKQRVEDEAKRKQDEVKREKEVQKKLIKYVSIEDRIHNLGLFLFRKEKKQLRDLCKEANYFNDSASPPNLKQVEQIETLIEYLSIENLKVLNEKLKEENADQRSIILSEVKQMDEQIQQSRLELSQQSSASSSTASTSNSHSNIKWTPEEIELLVKALRIYPAGVQNRWVVVQEYVKRSGGNPNRTTQDIMQKAKDVASGKKEVEETISSLDHIVLNSHKQSFLLENQAKLGQLTLSEREPDVPATAPWTVDEQRVFEQALRTYPASLGPSRWDQIAECLPTRNKKECLERYKELARIVQAKKATANKS
jgi:DnaJ family protein C protein 2